LRKCDAAHDSRVILGCVDIDNEAVMWRIVGEDLLGMVRDQLTTAQITLTREQHWQMAPLNDYRIAALTFKPRHNDRAPGAPRKNLDQIPIIATTEQRHICQTHHYGVGGPGQRTQPGGH